ncbi:MAG: complex I subunit 5 family protein [Thermomicrobiales bacterium]
MMLVLPLAIAWIGAVAIAILDGRRRWVGWLAVTCLAGSFGALVVLGVEVFDKGARQEVAGGWEPGVGIVLHADALGVVFAVLSIGVLLTALVFEVLGGVRSRSFPALILFMATGLTGLFLTGDIFNFYVFFEIAMISAYALTGYGEERRQWRAAAIFAIVNLLGSVLFLIAIAALYHLTGRLDMFGVGQRAQVVAENPAIQVATLIFIAFGVKLGLFPFHFWLPAVYTSTRPAVAAILGGALANIGSYGLLRFGAGILPRELEFGAPALYALGAMSIIYGAMQAISRHSVSEVIAYSAIGQVGYIMLALAIGGQVGFTAAVLYAIVNSMNKTLLFLSENLRGWLVGAAFVVGAFSVAGVPPAAGFFGKAALFRAGIGEENVGGSVALVVLIFGGGLLSLVYMFQIYQARFWTKEAPADATTPAAAGPTSPLARRVVVVALAVLVLAAGVWPEPLLTVSERAAQALGGGAP